MRPGFEADESQLVIQYLNQSRHLFLSTSENCFCELPASRLSALLLLAYQLPRSLLLISVLDSEAAAHPLSLLSPEWHQNPRKTAGKEGLALNKQDSQQWEPAGKGRD